MNVKRRNFITLLGGAAAAWPWAARAQQAARLPTIGFLGVGTRSSQGQWIDAWAARLRELGWIDGRTIAIEHRFAEGRIERFAEIAGEFVRLKVDVIFTSTAPAALALRQATSTIPIVFAMANDPVGVGLVASLARPGGNITGVTSDATDAAGNRVLTGKQIELLREVVPNLRRLAIMTNADNSDALQIIRDVRTAASTLGLEVLLSEIRRTEDIAPAFDALKGRADAVYVQTEGLVFMNRSRIAALGLAAHLPIMGGRRAGDLIDKILRGTKPADIPVEQPTKFDLVVNLITAKAIGLTIPETFLVRATEVIE